MVGEMEIINDEALKIMNEFEQAALSFRKIQKEHTCSLQRNQLADVQKWSDERSQAMGYLQQALNAVWNCDSLRFDARLGRSLQQRIGVIVERERELAENVRLCQNRLKEEMGKIRKGKKVIGGYGTTSTSRCTGLCFKNSL